jgi:hypothetical protein
VFALSPTAHPVYTKVSIDTIARLFRLRASGLIASVEIGINRRCRRLRYGELTVTFEKRLYTATTQATGKETIVRIESFGTASDQGSSLTLAQPARIRAPSSTKCKVVPTSKRTMRSRCAVLNRHPKCESATVVPF